jgi:hypothetical protein
MMCLLMLMFMDLFGESIGAYDVGERHLLVVSDSSDSEGSGTVWCIDIASERVVYTLRGASEDHFGEDLATGGDVNSDGISDVLVSSPKGYVACVSGIDGHGLYNLDIPASEPRSSLLCMSIAGTRVSFIGDVDDDSHDDFIVAMPAHEGHGSAMIVSGREGTLIRELHGSEGEFFGSFVAPVGRIDEDSVPDYAVTSGIGAVTLFSGATHTMIARLRTPDPTSPGSLGVVTRLEDSGRPCLAISQVSPRGGCVWLFVGESWEPTKAWSCTRGYGGAAIIEIEDLDGDEANDLLVTSPDTLSSGSTAYLISPKNGTPLGEITVGSFAGSFFGVSACKVGDLTGDGISEVAIGEATRRDGNGVGSVRIYSCANEAVVHMFRKKQLQQ